MASLEEKVFSPLESKMTLLFQPASWVFTKRLWQRILDERYKNRLEEILSSVNQDCILC